jgi:6-phosphogluconolactonase
MQVIRLADAEAVATHAAQIVADTVNATRETVHVALAGGTTPERCHELLAPLVQAWDHVHLWLSDERAVGPDDDASNFKMVRRSLLERISIPQGNVHRILGELGADEAADRYERELRETVVAGLDGIPVLDVAMAGMGPDGHTCSLFPGHPEVAIRDRFVAPVHDAPKPPPDRVTFTLPLLHATRRTLLLAAGASKRDAVARVIAGPDESAPASLLGLGALELIVDTSASPGDGG